MREITKAQLLKLIAGLPDGDRKRQFIAHLVKTNQLSEDDIAVMVVEDVRQNIEQYAQLFKTNDLLRILWNRFKDSSVYLARALVRVAPDIFYAYGFAFRLVYRLRAELGPILIPPRRPTDDHATSVYVERLPQEVQQDLLALDRERCFREYLYAFSRDVAVGFEMLDGEIAGATDSYDRQVWQDVREYCEALHRLEFPGFVTHIGQSPFPSFHVRWWIDKMREQDRVLNCGDTGTQKTAFATVAMYHYGCRKVLVVCAPHARTHWRDEICSYFRNGHHNHVALVTNQTTLKEALASSAQFVVIAYTHIIQSGVVDALAAYDFDGFIWDEAHYAKNVTGQSASERAKACEHLLNRIAFRKVIALTATPWENHPQEFAQIAVALRPDIFATAREFQQARPEDPRFLREFFASAVLEVELREIIDLPAITPKPWEDLFGVELIDPTLVHQAVYNCIREDETQPLQATQKIHRLMLASIHPHKLRHAYDWSAELEAVFKDELLSAKLAWIKQRVELELAGGAKTVIATGIYVNGITMPSNAEDEEEIWVGKLLQQWFGADRVLILDQRVSTTVDASGTSERSRLIAQWRSDPNARVLLVSMRTCPDSINLSVPALPGIRKLFLTALSYPWVPWKQFLGRFWRQGLGVPMEFRVPVLRGMIDEKVYRLGEKKWYSHLLFRAQVPLTDEELSHLEARVNVRRLAEEARSDMQKVNIIGSMVQGRGERAASQVLGDAYGTSSNGEIFARAFLSRQESGASGHISRYLSTTIQQFLDKGLLHAEGIFDAGCGPLTMERRLNLPVYGVDMNPHMIAIGRAASHCQGKNAQVGYLSQLPHEWTGKFELTVASLVLDWTSMEERVGTLPERLHILSELVRVTHPCGRVWITATEQSMNREILTAWMEALHQQGFLVFEPLTGLVTATDHTARRHQPFSFWSICFSPQGKRFSPNDEKAFCYVFETERMKTKRGGRDEDAENVVSSGVRVEHTQFAITPIVGLTVEHSAASEEVAKTEVHRMTAVGKQSGWRFHCAPTNDWRVLAELQRRGLLTL